MIYYHSFFSDICCYLHGNVFKNNASPFRARRKYTWAHILSQEDVRILGFSKLKLALRSDTYKFGYHCWPEMPDTFKFGSHKIPPYINTETNISPTPYCFSFLLSLQIRI